MFRPSVPPHEGPTRGRSPTLARYAQSSSAPRATFPGTSGPTPANSPMLAVHLLHVPVCASVTRARLPYERSHTGKKRYACHNMCPRRFPQKGHVAPHERPYTGENPYACSMCPRSWCVDFHKSVYASTQIHGGEEVCVGAGGTVSYPGEPQVIVWDTSISILVR